MSNIHGFNNMPQNRAMGHQQSENAFFGSGDGFQGLTVEHLRAVEEHKVLFLSGRTKVGNPRNENYWDMLQEMCCPVFKPLSLTTIMLVIYLGVFIAEAVIGLNREGELLEIDAETLIKMGANVPIEIRRGGVWRLITAAVLHINFMHFFGNFASTIILLSRFEYTFGTLRCTIIYILTAIGGNIFSALCNPDTIKAGASTCLYGLLGVMIGYILINWTGLSVIGPFFKCQLACICFMLVAFTMLFTSVGANNIDYFGHLGGFLSGLWLSGINQTIIPKQYVKRGFLLGVFGVQIILTFVLFYTLDDLFPSL